MIAKERLDLMNNTFSSVWLEAGLPRQKKILTCNLYREWQYLDQNDKQSLSPENQLARWNTFIEQWEQAASENKEIHVLGDVNIDFLKWQDPSQPSEDQTGKLNALVCQLCDKIFPLGFAQLIINSSYRNHEGTRFLRP